MAHLNLYRNCVVAIQSEFADGHVISTTCNRDIGFTPKNPRVDSISFSWATEVALLAEAHRRRLQRSGFASIAPARPAPGDELAYLQESRVRELQHFVDCGYYYRDDDIQALRKTLRGAFFSVWKLQQPVKKLRILLRDRQARRLWNELGMDGWRPPITQATASQPPPQPNRDTVIPLLAYQPSLKSGQLRIDRTPGTSTLWFGRQSVGSYLLMRWDTLVWLGFWGIVVLPQIWAIYQSYLFWGVPLRRTHLLIPAFVLLVLTLRSLTTFFRGLGRTRGTAMVSASHAGIHFTNAVGAAREGFLRREEIQNLQVIRREWHFVRWWYQLEATIVGRANRQPLLGGTDKESLSEAQAIIIQALGIERPNTAAETVAN